MAGTIGRMLRARRAGERATAWFRPGLEGPDVIRVTSPAFADGQPIPMRHAGPGVGENISPALAWTGVPSGAAELVLIVEDPDAPLRHPFVHVAIAGVPATASGFDEGALNRHQRPFGTGRGGFGRPGYTGPRPVAGHGVHHYAFQLFAVDVPLELPEGAAPGDIFEALETHVIARGRLTGTYER